MQNRISRIARLSALVVLVVGVGTIPALAGTINCVPPNGSLGFGGKCVDTFSGLILTSSARNSGSDWVFSWTITGTLADQVKYSEVYIGSLFWSSFTGTNGYSIQSEFNPPQPSAQPWLVHLRDGTVVPGSGFAPVLLQGEISTPEPATLGLLTSGLVLLSRFGRRSLKTRVGRA
jgi:hypothetical protein